MEQATENRAVGQAEGGGSPPPDSAKRRQIIEGARSVFLAQGFDRASMDEIARAAGVSKGTLYVYFSNKQRLFEELIIEDRREQAEQLARIDPADPDIRAMLTRFGISLAEMMQRPQTIALIRIVIAASAHFPDIGRTLYAAGPGHGIQIVSAYFDAKCAEGRLSMPDTRLAAAQFLELCLCDVLKPLLFNVSGPASREKIKTVVASAVNVVLAVYGPK
ncbi:MAG: TetR/AcrR family transcriptional regulator [Hyphomicrobiales bacterium]